MQSLQRVRLQVTRVWIIVIFALWMVSSPALATPFQHSESTIQLLRKGTTAFQDGRYTEAVTFFSQVVEQEPDYAVAYGNRCLSYLELDRYENAIADCTTAIKLASDSNPANPAFINEAFLNRGLAHYRTRHVQNAIADYTQVIQTSYDYRAFYNRGLAYADLGKYEAALQDYHQATSQAAVPKDALTTIRNDEGIADLMLGKDQEAIAAFSQAIQLNTTDIRSRFNRGCAYHRMGNEELALQDLNRVIALDPAYAQAYVHRGLIQIQIGQTEAAIASLTQAAQQFWNQGNQDAYHQAQQIIHRLQTLPEAFG